MTQVLQRYMTGSVARRCVYSLQDRTAQHVERNLAAVKESFQSSLENVKFSEKIRFEASALPEHSKSSTSCLYQLGQAHSPGSVPPRL